MNIKVKILNENQEQGNEEQEKLAGDVKGVEKAVGDNQAKTAMGKINTVDKFVQTLLVMIDQIDDNIDQKKIPLLIKKAYDEYRKKGKGNVNESLTSILTDPVILGSLAAALGVSVAALRGALSGGSNSSTLDDIRAKIEADSAYADELTRASSKKRKAKERIRMARARRNLDQMKADRAARMGGMDTDNPMGQISMNLDGGEASPEPTPEAIQLYANIVRKIRGNFGIKNQAEYDSLDAGAKITIDQAISAQASRLKKLKEFDESELKQRALQSAQIYENFKRFL